MRYQIHHRTTYQYDQDVSLSHHLARLTPAHSATQQCLRHELRTLPAEATRSEHLDHFGNASTFLTIEGPHRQLEITASSLVEIAPGGAPGTKESPGWEEVRDSLRAEPLDVAPEVVEFTFASPLVPLRSEFGAYAAGSFAPGRPVLDGVRDLASRIHRDFTFDSKATHVATPVGEFFKARRGVCQDFAHLMIAGLRSLGLAARYVSGYLETLPPEGQTKLIGADASHAWVAIWAGAAGWVDVDPTNDVLPSDRHITVALGRDFSDVSPVRGVILGSGAHRLSVAVDVIPVTVGERSPAGASDRLDAPK